MTGHLVGITELSSRRLEARTGGRVNILSIDQGTSATKALVIADDGSIVASAEVPVAIHPAGSDGIEQDPRELLRSVIDAGTAALAHCPVGVEAVALANQGESVIAMDPQSGKARSAVISWQDRRATALTSSLAKHAQELQTISGLPLDPYFTAPKMAWLSTQVEAGSRVVGIDAWLNQQLFGACVTDAATASRSLLLDLDHRTWSPRAAEIFNLELSLLPDIVPCAGALGETSVFGRTLPMTALVVDQQAALIGEGCLQAGQAKCTFGTGAFLLVTTGTQPLRSASGLSASVAWTGPGEPGYCLDGQVYTAGSAIAWLQRLGVVDAASDLDAVALAADRTTGALFVPAFAGLGAPHWTPSTRAIAEQLSLATGKAELVFAVLEGIAAQTALLVKAIEHDAGERLSSLKVDGGLTRSVVLMQLLSDFIEAPVEVCSSPDATALGTAALARWGAGADAQLTPFFSPLSAQFEPQQSTEQASERLERFAVAIRHAQESGHHG